MRITKREFDRLGGIANPALYRRQCAGRWYHYLATGVTP